MQQEVTLSNIGNGELERRFQEIVPALLGEIGKGKKGTIAINITFTRPEGMETMTAIEYSITPKFPATKRKCLASITGDLTLRQDVIEKPEEFNLFAVNGGKHKEAKGAE